MDEKIKTDAALPEVVNEKPTKKKVSGTKQNEEPVKAPSVEDTTISEKTPEPKKRFFRRNGLLLLLTLVFVLCGAYYFLRHWQPFTQNAFIVANTQPVSVLVEGFLTEIHVKNNQFVKKGDPIFTVFQIPYQLKVQELEYDIKSMQAELKMLSARQKNVGASIRAKQARMANSRYFAERAIAMYQSEAVSQAYTEERTRDFEALTAEVEALQWELEAIVAEEDKVNADIGKLQSSLALAQVYNEETVVPAFADGYVVNLYLSPGGYYHPGDVLCGFVASDNWYVQANFEETDLAEIQPGIEAEIALWQYPGVKLRGVVEEVNWGAERRLTDPATGVAKVDKENQWFLLPQRFPVVIRITEHPDDIVFHVGSSAYVTLKTNGRLLEQILWRIYQW